MAEQQTPPNGAPSVAPAPGQQPQPQLTGPQGLYLEPLTNPKLTEEAKLAT